MECWLFDTTRSVKPEWVPHNASLRGFDYNLWCSCSSIMHLVVQLGDIYSTSRTFQSTGGMWPFIPTLNLNSCIMHSQSKVYTTSGTSLVPRLLNCGMWCHNQHGISILFCTYSFITHLSPVQSKVQVECNNEGLRNLTPPTN